MLFCFIQAYMMGEQGLTWKILSMNRVVGNIVLFLLNEQKKTPNQPRNNWNQ